MSPQINLDVVCFSAIVNFFYPKFTPTVKLMWGLLNNFYKDFAALFASKKGGDMEVVLLGKPCHT
jgi:hypothetical protein